jgi:hypothetical protein
MMDDEDLGFASGDYGMVDAPTKSVIPYNCSPGFYKLNKICNSYFTSDDEICFSNNCLVIGKSIYFNIMIGIAASMLLVIFILMIMYLRLRKNYTKLSICKYCESDKSMKKTAIYNDPGLVLTEKTKKHIPISSRRNKKNIPVSSGIGIIYNNEYIPVPTGTASNKEYIPVSTGTASNENTVISKYILPDTASNEYASISSVEDRTHNNIYVPMSQGKNTISNDEYVPMPLEDNIYVLDKVDNEYTELIEKKVKDDKKDDK